MSALAKNAVEDTALTFFLECLPLVLTVIAIPLYLCVIRPLVHHCIPGMLKRMRLGIVVALLTGADVCDLHSND